MSAIQTSLYLVAIALCVFCTGLTTRRNTGTPLTFFTGYLFIQSAAFVFELLMAHPSVPLKALWLGLLMCSSLLVAPCLWLAFQESVAGVRLKLGDLPRTHWLAIGAGFLLTLPLIQTAHLGTTYYDPRHPVSWWHSRVIHTGMLLCIGIFVIQVPFYLIRCRQILLARIAGQGRHWAQLPLAILFTTWTLAILRTFDCAFMKWPPVFSLLVAVISVGVTVGALYLLLRQFSTPEKAAAGRYAKTPLSAPIRQRIRRKLSATLPQACRRNDLSLKALCELFNESPHYVSQVISQELNTSFYELVNDYRIAQAKRQLCESPGETVLSIAMSVGFNSKSAFHAAFRRCTGTTPGEYREMKPSDARPGAIESLPIR